MIQIDLNKYKPLSQLQEWEDNYNQGDVEGIARSIRKFGFNNALRVWRENIVMAGNHTCKALKLIREQGPKPDLDQAWPPANVIVEGDEWYVQFVDVSHLQWTAAKAFAVADNELARKSVADERLLAQYLKEIAEHDEAMLEATGFDKTGLARMLSRVAKALNPPADAGPQINRAAELREQWGVEPGQLWIIPSNTADGEHRLLCGDSTVPADVERLMNGQRAVLFSTDPPYLVDYDGTNHPHKWNEPDKNKDWSDEYQDWDNAKQGEALYDGFIAVAVEKAIVDDAAWYCWHASRNQAMLEQIWNRYGAFVHQQIIWVKDRPVLTRSWYMWQHEPCLFGWVKGRKPIRIAEDYPPTVWQIPTIAPGTSTDHPTSKPVDLFLRPMQQHTRPGDICYEPFAGSGSQFVAGEQLGRLVYGVEKNPGFVGVILERLKDMGLSPVLE